MRFLLSPASLLAWAGRMGFRAKVNAETRQIALLLQVLERDAPMILGGEGAFLIARLKLPFQLASANAAAGAAAVAALNDAGHPVAWSFDAARGDVAARLALPLAETEYSDRGLRAAIETLVAAVTAEAPRFAELA